MLKTLHVLIRVTLMSDTTSASTCHFSTRKSTIHTQTDRHTPGSVLRHETDTKQRATKVGERRGCTEQIIYLV